MEELEKLRVFLVGLLTEAREFSKKLGNHPTARAYINAKIEVLEVVTVFITKSIKEGVLDMEKAKSQIKVVDEGTIEELGRGRRGSPVTSKIIELANSLKPGKFVKIDHKEIEPSHFSTRVYNLRSMGLIPHEVKPKNNVNGSDGLFLVRLTDKQMSAEPQRRKGKVTTNGN